MKTFVNKKRKPRSTSCTFNGSAEPDAGAIAAKQRLLAWFNSKYGEHITRGFYVRESKPEHAH